METNWDSLIAAGWESIGIQHFINMDPVTGDNSITWGAYVITPAGMIIIEKATAAESLSILDGAMTSIGPADNYDEAALTTTVARSENDQMQRNAQRELDRATHIANND